MHAPGPTSPLPSESLVRDRSGLAQGRVESGVSLADSGPCYVPRLGYLISCWCLPPSVEQSRQLSKQWVRVSVETRVGQGGQDSPGRAARACPRAGVCIKEDILPPTPQRRLAGCLEAAMCSLAQVWYGSLAEALGAPSSREETGSAWAKGARKGGLCPPWRATYRSLSTSSCRVAAMGAASQWGGVKRPGKSRVASDWCSRWPGSSRPGLLCPLDARNIPSHNDRKGPWRLPVCPGMSSPGRDLRT